ncbi:MAG: thiopurine S-methyltransferase [Kofleriaceae bacterium]
MDPAFWRSRWAERKIGFHLGHPNPFLEANINRLDGRYRVLVPLCGKTEDLAFLAASGHAVVGVELVEDAVVEFFAEHALEPNVERRDDVAIYTAHELTVIAGDWFTTTPELIGPVDAVYDRAALIALPRELRLRYLDHLKTLFAPGTHGLVIALDYAEGAWPGPPFNVSDAEVRGSYKTVELLAEAPNQAGSLARAGIAAIERCYAVQVS